jgi:hypothetical protein
VILYCNFEELAATTAGANRLLSAASAGDHPVIAPPQASADLEYLLPLLTGDVHVATLNNQRRIQRALAYLLADLSIRMDEAIVEHHPAAEDAVLAYFDYAHVLSMLDRIKRMGSEMNAIIELATGAPADDDVARTFTFE